MSRRRSDPFSVVDASGKGTHASGPLFQCGERLASIAFLREVGRRARSPGQRAPRAFGVAGLLQRQAEMVLNRRVVRKIDGGLAEHRRRTLVVAGLVENPPEGVAEMRIIRRGGVRARGDL